jgi:hypothetical protein
MVVTEPTSQAVQGGYSGSDTISFAAECNKMPEGGQPM